MPKRHHHMVWKHTTRAQAALEFLMNYGWAILVVLVVIGALAYFGVLSPSKLVPEHCELTLPLSCADHVVGGDGILLSISNSGRSDIVVDLVKINSSLLPAQCVGVPVGANSIPQGEKRSLTAPCTVNADKKGSYQVELTYRLLGSPLQHISSGNFVSEPQGISVQQLCAGAGSACYSGGGSGAFGSCLALHTANPQLGDGDYPLSFGTAYCDMTTAGGGWTRIITLVNLGSKTNNALNKGITFTALRAVKADDRNVYWQVTFAAAQPANQGLQAQAIEANSWGLLYGPGGYGAYTGVSGGGPMGPCSWSTVNMVGAGYDGSPCGTESDLRVGQTSGGSTLAVPHFNVDIFVR